MLQREPKPVVTPYTGRPIIEGCLRLLAKLKLEALHDDFIDLLDGQMLIGNNVCHVVVLQILHFVQNDIIRSE